MSRGPVREALQQLEQEGLIVSSPHQGTYVDLISPDEMELLYELRTLVEVFAARQGLANLSPNALKRLRGLVDEMHEAAGAADVLTYIDKDIAFHEAMVQLAGSPRLTRLWRAMDGPMRMRMAVDKAARPEGLHQHRRLVEAMAAGDPDRVGAVLREHIEAARDLLLRETP